jgi:hypothetical protein
LFVEIDYWPVAIWFMLFSVRAYTGELYVACLNSALTLEFAVNLGLRYAFAQPPPYPGCGSIYEMPSFASEHACFLVVMILLAMVQWARDVQWYRAGLAGVALVVVLYARIHLAYNTPAQLFAGAAFGVPFGIVAHVLLVLLVAPYGDDIIHALPRWFGVTANEVMRTSRVAF